MRRKNRLDLIRVIVTLAIAVVVLFPIYWMIVTSVLPSSTVLSLKPPLVPKFSEMGLRSYIDVFARKPILTWFYNSLIVTLGSAGFSILVSITAGYSLSRYHTAGQQAMGYFLLLSRMLPGSLVVIPMYIIFMKLKMINSFGALILANVSAITPFSSWMMKGFFDSIPREMEEAGMIDGCSWFGTLRRIVLPLTLPGLAAVTIYAFILSWNEYLFARTLIYDPNKWIFTVGIASFIGEHSTDWSSLMAAGVVFIIPIILLFFFLEPYLVSGLTSGSVKD
jgi:multiple sugar transport system permease protein